MLRHGANLARLYLDTKVIRRDGFTMVRHPHMPRPRLRPNTR